MNRVTTNHVRLGDLLQETGLLSSDLITEAVRRFEEQGLPLGKALISSGYLDENGLKAALSIQYMVNDGLLAYDSGIELLNAAFECGGDLENAFLKLGMKHPPGSETNKIGQILIDAGVLDQHVLKECLETSQSTTLPIGHILCQRGHVSQMLLNRALLIQQLVRRGQVERTDGIVSLRAGLNRENKLLTVPQNKDFQKMPLKGTPLLGDFLVFSGVCTERRVREALTSSIINCVTLGASLVHSRAASRDIIESAITLQEMLDNKSIELELAKKGILEVKRRRILLGKALGELSTFRRKDNPSVLLVDLLTATGQLDVDRVPETIMERLEVNYNQISYVIKGLEDLLDLQCLYSAVRAVDLIHREKITREQALESLAAADKLNMSLDETLVRLGIHDRTRLKEPG